MTRCKRNIGQQYEGAFINRSLEHNNTGHVVYNPNTCCFKYFHSDPILAIVNIGSKCQRVSNSSASTLLFYY